MGDERARELAAEAMAGDRAAFHALERLHVEFDPSSATALENVSVLAEVAVDGAMAQAMRRHAAPWAHQDLSKIPKTRLIRGREVQNGDYAYAESKAKLCQAMIAVSRQVCAALVAGLADAARGVARGGGLRNGDTCAMLVGKGGRGLRPFRSDEDAARTLSRYDPLLPEDVGSALFLVVRHGERLAAAAWFDPPCGDIYEWPWRSLGTHARWMDDDEGGLTKSFAGKLRAWGWAERLEHERAGAFRTTIHHAKAWSDAEASRVEALRSRTAMVRTCQGCGKWVQPVVVRREDVERVFCGGCAQVVAEIERLEAPAEKP